LGDEVSRPHLLAAILLVIVVGAVIVAAFLFGGSTYAAVKQVFGIEENQEDDINAVRTLYLGMRYCRSLKEDNCLCDTGKSFTIQPNKKIRIVSEDSMITVSDHKTLKNAIACFMKNQFWEDFDDSGCGFYLRLYLNKYDAVSLIAVDEKYLENAKQGRGGGGTLGGGGGGGGAMGPDENSEGVYVDIKEKKDYVIDENTPKLADFEIDTDTLKLYKYTDEKGIVYLSFVDVKEVDNYRLCSDLANCNGEICQSEEECINKDSRYLGQGICCKICHKVLSLDKENEAENKFKEAVNAYMGKKYDEAEVLFKALIKDYGDSKRADDSWLYLGRIFRDKDFKKIAMEYYAHAVGDYYNFIGTDYGDSVSKAEEESNNLFECSDFSYKGSSEDAFQRFISCRDAKDSVLKSCNDPRVSDGKCEPCDNIKFCEDHKRMGEFHISQYPCENSLCIPLGADACEVITMPLFVFFGEETPTFCYESERKKDCFDLKNEWTCETEVCLDKFTYQLGIIGSQRGLRSLCCEWENNVCKRKV